MSPHAVKNRARGAPQDGRGARQSEHLYRAIVEDQTEIICRFRPDGTISFVNEAFCRYFGKVRKRLSGRATCR